MGVYIPNMSKPKSCWECFNADCDHWGEHGYDNSADCPLIDIVHCGECKHYAFGSCSKLHLITNPENFCSDGERK